jgi:hypothetical protein
MFLMDKMKLVIFFLFLTLTSARIIMIGDSIFDGSKIHYFLESFSNTTIENYSKSGAMITGFPSIPFQYYQHSFPSPQIIIMDGGANDILDLLPTEQVWHTLTLIQENLNQLFLITYQSNVQHIIYLCPYYISNMHGHIDTGIQLLESIVENSPISISLVDVRNFTIPLKENDIHPNEAGDLILATQIWNKLKLVI